MKKYEYFYFFSEEERGFVICTVFYKGLCLIMTNLIRAYLIILNHPSLLSRLGWVGHHLGPD